MKHSTLPLLALLLFAGGQTLAIEAPSLALGKTLFEATNLGESNRSCGSCHAAGKGLDQIGDFNDAELKDLINACLRDALKAQSISTDSQEMNALLGYVRTFQKN